MNRELNKALEFYKVLATANMAIIQKGQKAPDFTLINQREEEVKLSSLRGKQVVLSWHPLAFTSVCTDQMRDLERNVAKFRDKNALAIGISIDHLPVKKAWATILSITETSIVSDFKPFAKVTREYGIYNEMLGASGRGVVIVDEDGLVKWSKEYDLPELPDLEEILSQL